MGSDARSEQLPEIECRVFGQSAGDFVRWMSSRADVTVVLDQKYYDSPVYMDVRDTVDVIMQILGRQLGAGVARLGRSYYIGAMRDEDMGLLVRKMRRLGKEEIKDFIVASGSTGGRVTVFDDGLLVMVDHLVVLRRVSDAIDAVEAVTVSTWLVQVYFLRVSDRRESELSAGLELEAAYRFAGASGAGAKGEVQQAFGAWLRARGQSTSGAVRQAPLLVVTDGGEATLHSGRTIPVAKKAILDSGAVATTDFKEYRDGLQMKVGIRGEGYNAGMLSLDLSNSSITGYVEAAPIIAEDTLSMRAVVSSGGAYLVGSLRVKSDSSDTSGWLSVGRSRRVEDETLEVWVRAYRIAGSAEARPEGVPRGPQQAGAGYPALAPQGEGSYE